MSVPSDEPSRVEPLEGSRFQCPECHELLSLIAFVYKDARELGIRCTCEWCDYEGFEIRLRVKKGDLKRFMRDKGIFVAESNQKPKQGHG